MEEQEFRLGPVQFLWEFGLFVVIAVWLIALVNPRGHINGLLAALLSAVIVALVSLFAWRVWNIKVILASDSITLVNLVRTITLPYQDCVRARVAYGIMTFPTTCLAIDTKDGNTHRSAIRSQWTSIGAASEVKIIRKILLAVNAEFERRNGEASQA